MNKPSESWTPIGIRSAAPNPNPSVPIDPRDALSQDALLMLWQQSKDQLEAAKENEMNLRKYIVKRAFPNPSEGMNTQELGNGYELKAGVKFNYKLSSDNKVVEAGLDELSNSGNDGSFIADRLVSWSPNFLLNGYREIQEAAKEGSELAKQRLFIISKFMEITEAAPTLNIKAPKK